MRRVVLPVFAVCAAMSSCKNDGGSAEFPQMEIVATYPVTGAFTTVVTVCAGSLSTLVSFDTDGDRTFEYRFLYDASGQTLHGCNGPCEDGVIHGEIPVPRRVMIEGITVPPEEYGIQRHDVACRGIADAEYRMGKIVVSPLNFPGLDDSVYIEVPMLRVGAFNGMYGTDVPVAPGMPTALLVPPESRKEVQGDLRVGTGGIVVAAGGFDPLSGSSDPFFDVWEFHPWEIAWRRVAATTTGHYYGNAESFVDAGGAPAVLFVGGLGTNGGGVFIADAYHPGKVVTEGFATESQRLYSGVVRAAERAEPVIAVLGGCYLPPYSRDFELFFPVARPASCAGAGTPGFCTPPSVPGVTFGEMVEAKCQAGFQTLSDGRLWFGTGVTDDDEMTALSYLFDPSEGGDYGVQMAAVQVPVRQPATVLLHDDVVGMFGGILTVPTDTVGVTDRWVAFDPVSGPIATGLMRAPRGHHTANRLLDGRVLIAAGVEDGDAPLATAEIFERANAESGGEFENIAPAGRTSCVAGVDCEQMSQLRFAHTATTVAGSATWLEGAVLITGGSDTGPGGTPELFVPAYACEGTKPVNRFDGVPVPDVELCDRLREPAKLTDPRKPKRF